MAPVSKFVKTALSLGRSGLGLLGAVASVGCISGTMIIEPGAADRQLLHDDWSNVPDSGRLNVAAVPRYVSFPDTYDSKPAGLDLYLVKFPGAGHIFQFPIRQAFQDALGTMIKATFETPDERPEPIGSDNLDIEFRLLRAEFIHGGDPGPVQCKLRLNGKVRLPSDYLVNQFNAVVNISADHPAQSQPNALWKAAAAAARDFHNWFQTDDFRSSVAKHRVEEWVCQKTGHKKGLGDQGKICTLHGTQFVQRVALKD